MRAKLFFAFLVLIFFAVTKSALAVSVTISSSPSTINQDPFTIVASVSGASTGTNYLRIDIFKDGSDNYFGQTYNGSNWYSGSTYTEYLPITIQSGIPWSGNIQGQVGAPSLTEYDGSGTYKIRLRRYTESGGTNATEANGSAVSVSINIPTPTQTPAQPTATPKLTPTNTPVPTPTPKITASTPIPKKSVKITPKISPEVLGDKTDEITKNVAPTIEVLADSQSPETKDNNIIPKVFISIGIVFLILCGIVIAYPIIKKMKDKNINE